MTEENFASNFCWQSAIASMTNHGCDESEGKDKYWNIVESAIGEDGIDEQR